MAFTHFNHLQREKLLQNNVTLLEYDLPKKCGEIGLRLLLVHILTLIIITIIL